VHEAYAQAVPGVSLDEAAAGLIALIVADHQPSAPRRNPGRTGPKRRRA
jgi:hypothetical protein